LTDEYELLANLNPFRYRGYVWDDETGLYYLRSRYYNCINGRFTNSDFILQYSGGIHSNNLFSYCINSPIIYTDKNGCYVDQLIRTYSKKIDKWLDEEIPNIIGMYVNSDERKLIMKHPIAAIAALQARKVSFEVTAAIFGPNWNSDDTRENAFKHCLWNALMAHSIGADLAKEFGDAHESGMMESYPQSTSMDLHNNLMGYMLVFYPITIEQFPEEGIVQKLINQSGNQYSWETYIIIDRVYKALEDGRLIYLRE